MRSRVLTLLPQIGRGPREHVVAGHVVHHGVVNYGTGRATDVDPSTVETRDDFAQFLSAVLADFRSAGRDEWENGTLDRFLDGLWAFAGVRVAESLKPDQEQASWRLFAEILRAATGYE